LGGAEAARTGEAARGIGALADDPSLADYLGAVRPFLDRGAYPGSPALIRALLRPDDRMACCELRDDDSALLRRVLRAEPRAAVHRRDAWEAVTALLPPKQTRGLVLIDPPFEASDEFDRLAAGIAAARARFPGGVVAGWYPIKHRAPVRAFHAAIRAAGVRDSVAVELWLREPLDPARLNGCGLLIAAPPYRFDSELPPILAALAARLGEPDAGWGIERLTDE
jgi:23S rRNA (adenine2030-N6)-methyltransferase